jgi:hypothetical protein
MGSGLMQSEMDDDFFLPMGDGHGWAREMDPCCSCILSRYILYFKKGLYTYNQGHLLGTIKQLAQLLESLSALVKHLVAIYCFLCYTIAY